MKRLSYRKIALLAAIVLLSAIVAMPFVLMLLSSFKTMAEIQSPVFRILPNSFSFNNYIEAMNQGNWSRCGEPAASECSTPIWG